MLRIKALAASKHAPTYHIRHFMLQQHISSSNWCYSNISSISSIRSMLISMLCRKALAASKHAKCLRHPRYTSFHMVMCGCPHIASWALRYAYSVNVLHMLTKANNPTTMLSKPEQRGSSALIAQLSLQNRVEGWPYTHKVALRLCYGHTRLSC